MTEHKHMHVEPKRTEIKYCYTATDTKSSDKNNKIRENYREIPYKNCTRLLGN